MKGLKIFIVFLGMVAGLFSLTSFAFAATLDLGSDSGAPGTDVTIEIILTDPDNVVAATSNDITFDTTYLENPSCAIGPAGAAASKDVTCGLIPPGVPGMYRVGVFGFNINVIQDGVVAYVTFHIKDDAPCEIPPLETILSNDPSASDAYGGAVDVTGSADGKITIVCCYITTPCPLPECNATTRQVENMAMAGINYEFQLEATEGCTEPTWDIVTGLPDGLLLDPYTGLISGNPQEIGQFCFTLNITDALLGPTDAKDCSMRVHLLGDADNDNTIAITEIMTVINGYLSTFPDGSNCIDAFGSSHSNNIAVAPQLEILTPCPLPECNATTRQVENMAMAGIDYEFQLEATGGPLPYTWDIVTGGLPDGLVLEPGTGVISGNPQEIGQFCFTVQVTDGNSISVTKECSMKVYLLGDANNDNNIGITEIMTVINGYLGTFPDGSNCA